MLHRIKLASRHGNGLIRSVALIVAMGAIWTTQIAQFL